MNSIPTASLAYLSCRGQPLTGHLRVRVAILRMYLYFRGQPPTGHLYMRVVIPQVYLSFRGHPPTGHLRMRMTIPQMTVAVVLCRETRVHPEAEVSREVKGNRTCSSSYFQKHPKGIITVTYIGNIFPAQNLTASNFFLTSFGNW